MSQLSYSNRLENIEESKSVRLSAKVEELRRAGKDVISFHIGELDNRTPEGVLDATIQALQNNQTRYSLVPGLFELREKIASYHQNEYAEKISDKNIFLSNGSKQVIYSLFQNLINEGDEVIVPAPYWVTYPESIKLAGGSPIFVDSEDLTLDLNKIEKAIGPNTKAIIVNSPNNPSGLVFPKEQMIALAKLCYEKKIWLISDEAYEKIVFDGLENIHPHGIDEKYFENIIAVKSFSKTFCMTGFRLGYLIGNEQLCKNMSSLQSHLSGNNCTFAQYGAIAALEMGDKYLKELLIELTEKRDLAFELSKDIFPCPKPQGGFFLFPDMRDYLKKRNMSCEDLALEILEKAQVSLLPGLYFGKPGYLRISFSPSLVKIKEGFKRIKAVL